MIENPCKKCDDPAMGCANTCGDLAEYRYIEKLEKELKQAKKLLQAAVDFVSDGDCSDCVHNSDGKCPAANDVCKFEWIHKAEALALIEDGST